MKTWMRSALSLLCVLGVACGGDDNKIPAEKSFTYGPGTQVAAGSSIDAANAQTAVAGLSSALNGAFTDSSVEQVAGVASSLVGDLLGSVNTPIQPKIRSTISARLAGASAVAPVNACITVTADKVTYACSESQGGNSFSMNGYIQKTGGTVSWDITISSSGSDSTGSGTVTAHHFGNLTVTASTIVGSARADVNMNGTYNGQAINVSASQAVNLDLAYYQTCITSGTVEAKLWWRSSQGATGAQDVAVKLTFSDGGPTTCAQTVTIARSQ